MHSTLRCVLAITCLILVAPGARAESKFEGKVVTFRSGDEETQGYLAEPMGKGPFPAIVVIQEWWGLTDWIKENANRFAAQGYVAFAPDLYRGKVAKEPLVARQLLQGMPRDRALRDLKASVDFLAGRDNVLKDRLGSIGWCMGGGYSLQLALRDERLQASVICYGAVVTDPTTLKPLRATILGIFGEDDKGIKPETVRKFEDALKSAGKHVEAVKEFKAGHGFMRPFNAPGKPNPEYRESEALQAWKDVDAFFTRALRKER